MVFCRFSFGKSLINNEPLPFLIFKDGLFLEPLLLLDSFDESCDLRITLGFKFNVVIYPILPLSSIFAVRSIELKSLEIYCFLRNFVGIVISDLLSSGFWTSRADVEALIKARLLYLMLFFMSGRVG